MKNDDHIVIDGNEDTADNICEECRKEDESEIGRASCRERV